MLAPIPPNLSKPCARPVFVEEKAAYPAHELLTGWQTDASHLVACGTRFQAYVAAVQSRDAAQGGAR